VPILWRVIEMGSPKFFSAAPRWSSSSTRKTSVRPEALRPRPAQGQVPAPERARYVVKDEVSIECQHCVREYGAWRSLVSSMSKSGKLVIATDEAQPSSSLSCKG
jgi:hypothetical protein